MKTAIISGCGRMGLSHARALAANNIRIEYICDPKEEALNAFAAKLKEIDDTNEPYKLRSISELPDKHNIDISIISTTTDGRFHEATAALNANIPNLLLEKPVSKSLDDCSILEQTAKLKQIKIAVNHQMRYLEQYQSIKKLLTHSQLGHLSTMTVNAGNFGLAMNACHYFEAFRYLCDESISMVSADFDEEKVRNPRGDQFSDVSGFVCAKTKSGKRLFINSCVNSGHGLHITYLTNIARITLDELTGELLVSRRNDDQKDQPTTKYALESISEKRLISPFELVKSTSCVINDLINNRDYPTIQDGKQAIKALIGAYHSNNEHGRTIAIDNISDYDKTVYPWA